MNVVVYWIEQGMKRFLLKYWQASPSAQMNKLLVCECVHLRNGSNIDYWLCSLLDVALLRTHACEAQNNIGWEMTVMNKCRKEFRSDKSLVKLSCLVRFTTYPHCFICAPSSSTQTYSSILWLWQMLRIIFQLCFYCMLLFLWTFSWGRVFFTFLCTCVRLCSRYDWDFYLKQNENLLTSKRPTQLHPYTFDLTAGKW